MRNLKKILALVLALMMTLSVMVTANAASKYSDQAQIDGKYDEAVEVLTGLGVYRGTDATANTFNPKANITRAEVSALVYRITSGDTTDRQNGIYADYNKFTDVPSNTWYAGYVNYAANGKYIVGDGKGNFYPFSNVTGYEVLAIMLRAIGYGQNGEFEGAGWQVRVATLAKELGITDTVAPTVTLGKAVTREVVAELLFCALTKPATVTYTPALGYNQYVSLTNGGLKNLTLGEKTFSLYANKNVTVDMWGRPGNLWYKSGTATVNGTARTWAKGTKVATVAEKPAATFTTAVAECDIADAVGLTKDTAYRLYYNGSFSNTTGGNWDGVSYEANGTTKKYNTLSDTNAKAEANVKAGTNLPTRYVVQPTDTTQKLGGQGTLLEVYEDRIVHIDTFLAQVTNVTEAKFDKAGHLVTPATISLWVYDVGTNSKSDAATPAQGKVTLQNGETNFTYKKGDLVLANLPTMNYTEQAVDNNTGTVLMSVKGTMGNTTILEANKGVVDTAVQANANNYLKVGTEIGNGGAILGLAKSVSGRQTNHQYGTAKHQVEGVNYNDAARYLLDEAMGYTDQSFNWLFDSYGNLIGSVRVLAERRYGIIQSIRWNADGTSSDENGYAIATIRYMDGTGETVSNVRVNSYSEWQQDANNANVVTEQKITLRGTYADVTTSYTKGYVAHDVRNNYHDLSNPENQQDDGWDGRHLYEITTEANGGVNLAHVATSNYTVNPATGTNNEVTGVTVTQGNSTLTNATAPTGSENLVTKGTPVYTQSGTATTDAFRNGTLRVSATAKIMVQTATSSKGNPGTYVLYSGAANLKAYANVTVDWADINEDGYADYVYITNDAGTAAGTNGLVYTVPGSGDTATATAVLKDNKVDYYVINGIKNGSGTTETINVSVAGMAKIVNTADTANVGSTTVRTLGIKTNVLFAVQYNADGVVTDALDLTDATLDTDNDGFVDLTTETTFALDGYKDMRVLYYAANSSTANVADNNGHLLVGNADFLLDGHKVVYGDALVDGQVLTSANIFVVSKIANNSNVAVEVYYNTPSNSIPSGN